GGNRKGAGRQIVNILIVWFLTGLWHGASWNFALWGLYFAALLIAEKLFLLNWLKRLPRALGHLYALFFAVVGWAIFNFVDFSEMSAYLSAMFIWTDAGALTAAAARQVFAYLPTLLLCAAAATPFPKKLWLRATGGKRLAAEAAGACLLFVLCASAIATQTYNPFIYFRF
ncbi:MAG: MBOAT family protein, partial [Clostridiales bacterium]|nr:MBOAT family protein [Clostridiales bacterium]